MGEKTQRRVKDIEVEGREKDRERKKMGRQGKCGRTGERGRRWEMS